MNQNKYSKLRALILLLGIPYAFLGIFWKREKKRIIFNSQYNTQFSHNSKFLFLYFVNVKTDYEVKYVINDKVLREKLLKQYGDFFIDSESIKNRLYILSAKTWVTSSLETPIGGVFHCIRRNVFHLGHGSPLKNVGLGEAELGIIKKIYYRLIKHNFTYFFSTAASFNEIWKKCLNISSKQVLITGQARNDRQVHLETKQLVEKYLDKGFKHILYAPTWRPYADTKLFPFDDFDKIALERFLLENKIKIHLRLHPSFESDKVKSEYDIANVEMLGTNKVSDINELLFEFDLLITDYSSIYIDYLITEKPMLFLPYDFNVYNEKIGFAIDFHKNTPGPKPINQLSFVHELKNLLLDKDYYKNDREKINNALNVFTTEQCRHNAELIEEKGQLK